MSRCKVIPALGSLLQRRSFSSSRTLYSVKMTREFDLIIFGASGMAGKYCIEQMHKASDEKLNWAIAGRDETKLRKVLSEVSSWVDKDLGSTPIVIADVHKPDTLSQMAGRSRCIINTVGPYTQWGEQVIKACIDEKTHLLDLSGELHFNESMRNKYHKTALENEVYIIPTAGFDSVACEMLLKYMRDNFEGKINSFESHAFFNKGKFGSTANTGTLFSLMEIFSNVLKMPRIRREAFEKIFSQPWQPLKFKKGKSYMIGTRQDVPGYAMPGVAMMKPSMSHSEFFRREVDPTYERSEIQMYLCSHSLAELLGLSMAMGVVVMLSQFPPGRSLLYKYPDELTYGNFKRGGPTREQTTHCDFNMYAIGTGWGVGDSRDQAPTKRIIARLDGPEVGYIATSTCLVQSAISLLKEGDKAPLPGGCLPAGFALEKTSLMERLVKNGFKFQILQNDK